MRQLILGAGGLPLAKPGIPRLQAKWFKQWTAELDDALACMPEPDSCPHQLFRLLATNPGLDKKVFALVHERGTPVAVAALRKTIDARWVPVTHYVVPGFISPVQDGRLMEAMVGLGIPVNFAFWRLKETAPDHGAIRLVRASPTYGMDCSDDFEAYWRKTGRWNSIRPSRRKCSAFTVEINKPGAARSIIETWARRWGISQGELSDRLVAAEYLESIGRHVSILLSDGSRSIGGATCFIHDDQLVAGVYFRDEDYDRYDLGTFIIYLTFDTARTLGLKGVDLGGGQAYKERYAPRKGATYDVTVCASLLKYQWGRLRRKLQLPELFD